MKLLEQQYITPAGYRDFPFAYVFSASSLTDGNTYQDIQIALQGDSQFILRHIAGVTQCVASVPGGGRWNYKGHNRSTAIGNPSSGIVAFPNWPVVPEKIFDYNEAIWLDLYSVLRANNSGGGDTVYTSQIAFFGLKRYAETNRQFTVTDYRYREAPQRYEFTVTIDWPAYDIGTTLALPHRFIQQMDNYDFELLRISIGQEGQTGTLTTQDFAMTLYDPHMHQLSSAPLLQGYFNVGKPTPSTQPTYQGCFPVPTIVYPAGSAITFDIQSLLPAPSVRQTYHISFEGVWRLPC